MSGTAHIVALSGGKDSTAMALRLREIEPATRFQFVCTPTGNELPAMLDHWAHLQELLDMRLVVLNGGDSLGSLVQRFNALPNWRQRWCTRMLKIEPFERYLAAHLPAVTYVGIRADETERAGMTVGEGVSRRFPLVEWGWGLADVIAYLDTRGVAVPERTDCAACFFQTLGEWYALWRDNPAHYAQAEAWEAATGHTLRSPSRDSHPPGLLELRAQFEAGYAPKPARMHDRATMCSVCAH